MLRVNIFWFLSLVVSISCALAAILLQQWSRRYLSLSQRDTSIHQRARMRTFLFEGVKKFHLTTASKIILALLHASVFLFFSGLVQFAFAINNDLAWAILGAIVVIGSAYALLTVMPLISTNSPYFTPASTPLWILAQSAYSLVLFLPYLLLRHILPLSSFTAGLLRRLISTRDRLEQGITGGISACATPDRDAPALGWLCRRLVAEGDFPAFVSAIPGYLHARRGGPAARALVQAVHDNAFGARLGRLLVSAAALPDHDPPRARIVLACLDAMCAVAAACVDVGGARFHRFDPSQLAYAATRLLRDDTTPILRVAARCATAMRTAPLLLEARSSEAPASSEALLFVPTDVRRACTAYGGPGSDAVLRDGLLVAAAQLVEGVLPDLRSLPEARRVIVTDTLRVLLYRSGSEARNASGEARAMFRAALEAARECQRNVATEEEEAVYECVLRFRTTILPDEERVVAQDDAGGLEKG